MSVTLLHGDCRALLPTLPEASVQCVVTSPPYWGLRDYGVEGQIGLEPTPEAYLAQMVAVFRAVRRVLRDDGTLWLNMGDSYAGGGGFSPDAPSNRAGSKQTTSAGSKPGGLPCVSGLKAKDLVGIPWRLAFALQADGWYLRSDIIWAKPNPMPESVTDRPTKAHEYVFLLTKSARYFYDADAVREPASLDTHSRGRGIGVKNAGIAFDGKTKHNEDYAHAINGRVTARNLRSVWTLPTEPTPEAHFATFPTALASRCIQAGTSEKGCCAACGAPWARQVERTPATVLAPGSTYGNGAGRHDGGRSMLVGASAQTTGWTPACTCDAPTIPCTVLDPFAGSGTVGAVAEQLGRHSILIELSAPYVAIAKTRTAQCGLFAYTA